MRTHDLFALVGTLVLGGCVIDQKLGETLGDESGTASGDASGGPGSATDDGSASQSNTSAQPGTTTVAPGDGSTSGDGTDSDGGTDPGTETGVPGECPLGPDSVRLQWAAPVFEPVEGVSAQFAAALEGACAMEMTSRQLGMDPDEFAFELALECTLDGRVDADPVAAQPFSIDIQMSSADIDPALLSFASAQDVTLRLAADFWGMGWGVWFVIERGDGTILLDVVHGPSTSPTEPAIGISEDVIELLDGEPWHGGLLVEAVQTECTTFEDKCGGEERAIALGWNGTAQIEVEVDQLGTIGTDIEETSYRANVHTARAYPMPLCTDLPDADYGLAVWAEEP